MQCSNRLLFHSTAVGPNHFGTRGWFSRGWGQMELCSLLVSSAHYWSLSGCVAQFLTGHRQMLVCGPRDGDSCSTVKGTYQDLSKLRGDQKER